jgi:hypothetical protein
MAYTKPSIVERIRDTYLDPELMRARIQGEDTLAERLWQANRCLATALDPQGKFGLGAVPDAVIAVIREECERAIVEAAPIRALVVDLRSKGAAWDECWSAVRRAYPGSGFGPGDGHMLTGEAN